MRNEEFIIKACEKIKTAFADIDIDRIQNNIRHDIQQHMMQ